MGPSVTFLAVAGAQGSPINPVGGFYPIPTNNFLIVVEGGGPSAVGTSTFNPSGAPDLQIVVDHALGNGSLQVCDKLPSQGTGGVPASAGFSDSPPVIDALNDFGCYFMAYGRDDACLMVSPGEFGFRGSTSTVQFCSVPIPSTLSFPSGDTVVRVRLRDVNGTVGPVAQMIVRVGAAPTMLPATPSATPSRTATSPALATTTSTYTQTPTPSVTPTPPPTASATLIATQPATPTLTEPPTATLTPVASPTGTSTATSIPISTATPTTTALPSASPTPNPSPSPTPRIGDCNGDGQITLREILATVNIALGKAGIEACRTADVDRDGRINVDEVVTVVNRSRT